MTEVEVAELYDTYLQALSAKDSQQRTELLLQCTTDEFEIRSPGYVVQGRSAAAAKLDELLTSNGPPRKMERTSVPDGHHGVYRMQWKNTTDDGSQRTVGTHFIDINEDRISRIVVFIE